MLDFQLTMCAAKSCNRDSKDAVWCCRTVEIQEICELTCSRPLAFVVGRVAQATGCCAGPIGALVFVEIASDGVSILMRCYADPIILGLLQIALHLGVVCIELQGTWTHPR